MLRIVVEGESDRGAAEAIVKSRGFEEFSISSKGGVSNLDKQLAAYNRAAARGPWLVIRDSDAKCPVRLRSELIDGEWSSGISLRLACSMIEAWLMADAEKFAAWFSVSLAKVPSLPDDLEHAKRSLLTLCSSSRSRDIRTGVVTQDGNRAGPLYVSVLNDYARTTWRPDVAAESSPSLARGLRDIDARLADGRWTL